MKTRTEKFARILAIMDLLSEQAKEYTTVGKKYTTDYFRKPAKFLKVIHEEIISRSHAWGPHEWMLFEIMGDEIAALEMEDVTDEQLDEMFSYHLYRARNDMRYFVGVNEASEILGITPGTVKNHCAEGKIPARKIGKTWIMDKRLLIEEGPKMKFEMNYDDVMANTGHDNESNFTDAALDAALTVTAERFNVWDEYDITQ